MSEESDVEEEPVFLVKVTGFSSKTTKDALLNFFENTRRSGGGEIKDIQLNQDEGFADIIFWSNQDAETVAQNDNLELDGATLITTLKPLPKELPIDPRRIHAVGISDKTTNDGLKSFMEVVSRSEVEGLLFGSNSDCIISFKEIIDFHEVQKMCKHNSLDDNFLSIEKVRICDCIEVSGLAPKTTRDAIFYYFRNKRNGGGDVKSYEDIDVSKRKMVLSFEDPNVLESIMNQDHVVDGARLNVRRYYPFLGETSLINPARAEKRNIVTIDHQNALFITEFFHQEFDQLLQNSRVTYTWQQGSGEIVLGCAEPKMDKKTWEKSCEAVVAYINQIVTEKIAVSREIWKKISEEMKEKCAVFEHQISIQHVFDFRKRENSIALRGKKTDVCDLMKQLQDLISLAEKQIMIEKSKIVKKIEPSEVQMELLSFSGFVDGLKTRYEGLEVSVINESSSQVIQVRGLEAEVNDCVAFVWQTLSRVKEGEMKFSKPMVNILASNRGKEFIATVFKENSVEATSFGGTSDNDHVLVVNAMDRDHMNKAVDFIKNAIAEERIPLDVDKKRMTELEKWKELKLSLKQSVLLQFTEEPATSTILLVGIKGEVDTAKEKIERFFQDNLTLLREIELEKMLFKTIFLTDAQLELFNCSELAGDLKARFKNLEIKFSKEDGAIYFRGPDAVVREVNLCMWQTLSEVKEMEMKLPKSIVAVLGSKPGKAFLATRIVKEDIQAVVNRDPNSENQLIVTAVDRKDAITVIDLIRNLTSEQGILLDDLQKQLINSENWKELKHSIQQNMLVEVREEPAASTLWVAGIKEEVDHAKEQVDDFFEENIILDKVINAENGRLKFIFRHRKDTIQSIEKSLAKQSVKITKKTYEDDKVSAIVVSGTKNGIQQAIAKVQELIDEIKERTVKLNKTGMRNFFSRKKGMILLSLVEEDHDCIIERTMHLQIYADSEKNLTRAEMDIYKMITDNSKKKEIEHKAVSTLSDSQIGRVMRMEASHHTNIKIDKRINRNVIKGVVEDVSEATVAVYGILNERSEEEHTRRYAELLCKNIQWCYEDGTSWDSYDEETNAEIEKAYQDKKPYFVKSLKVEDGITRYEIDFNARIEKNLDTGEIIRVERRDKRAGIPLPAHWEPQPKGSDGKEVELHMVVLDPAKHQKEYDKVKSAMQKTLPRVNIVKIERVQNPMLYDTYTVKKQKMDDQKSSNEKKLFYGTDQGYCQLINHRGFNRSYCGKNGTVYGKGVYFARDASYSERYSPLGASGNRYMYLTSVLVGEYTVGHPSMITTPPKNPNNPIIRYDTVVDNITNPAIFVAFHDVQGYPEYLITFQ